MPWTSSFYSIFVVSNGSGISLIIVKEQTRIQQQDYQGGPSETQGKCESFFQSTPSRFQ